jgi:hypothetical protein
MIEFWGDKNNCFYWDAWLDNIWCKDLLPWKSREFCKLRGGLFEGEPLLSMMLLRGKWFFEKEDFSAVKLDGILLCLFGLNLGPRVWTEELNRLESLGATDCCDGLLEAFSLVLDELFSLIVDIFIVCSK